MKKIILISPLLLLFSVIVSAQGFHFGIKGGADLHKIEGSSFKDEFNAGYHLGAFAEIGLPGKIGFQPEVYFSQVNTRIETGAGSVFTTNGITKVKLSYLNIPLLLDIRPVKVLSIQAGPQFGIRVNKDNNFVQNGKDAFKNGDVGIAAGLQLNLTKLKIYGRYVAGLNDINDANTQKWHNQAIHIGLGLRIF